MEILCHFFLKQFGFQGSMLYAEFGSLLISWNSTMLQLLDVSIEHWRMFSGFNIPWSGPENPSSPFFLVLSLPSKHNSQKVPKIPISPKETVATDVNEKDLKSKWCQQLCIFLGWGSTCTIILRYCFTLKLMSGSQDFYCLGGDYYHCRVTVASSFAPAILPTQTQHESMPCHNVYLFNVQVAALSWSLPKLSPNASLHHCMMTYLHSQVQCSSQQYYVCFLFEGNQIYEAKRKQHYEDFIGLLFLSTNGSTTSCLESGPSSSQLEGHKHHDDASISGRLYLGT